MDRRLVRVVVWLVVLVFVADQAPRAGVKVHQEPESEARARQAIELAAKLVVTLPGILEQFKARRRELAEAAYPQEGVAALLDSTETSLQKEFQTPDFYPLRDHIAEVFAEARSRLELPTRAALLPSPTPQAIFASLHFTDRSLFERVFDGIRAFLEDLEERATKNDLVVDLCVTSVPPKAKVSLSTAGDRQIEIMQTNGRIQKLIRGNYFYTVESRRLAEIVCRSGPCRIDLYDKRQPLLSCEWNDGSGDCFVKDGWSEACRGR